MKNLSLPEYISACRTVCSQTHSNTCQECKPILTVAQTIIDDGFVVMSEAFRNAYPSLKYTAEIARRKFLQMPLVNIVIGNTGSGRACSYLVENQPGMDYTSVYHLISSVIEKQSNVTSCGMLKETLKSIMSLASSDRERELIRVTTFVAGKFSQSSARKQLGLEDMNRRTAELEKCAMEVKEIKDNVEEIAQSEIHGLAINHGLDLNHSSSENEDSEAGCDDDEGAALSCEQEKDMADTLKDSHFNWFEFICQMESKNNACTKGMLNSFHSCLSKFDFTERELVLTRQSYLAYKADEDQYSHTRNQMERILNGDVVTDSESDNDLEYYNVDKVEMIKKKLESIKRCTKRRIAKRIAARKFLQRSYSKRTNCIVEKYPDIGESIENFVQSCNVGADAWRRTGVLTFDGNVKVQQKSTYKRIQHHLQEKYGRPFSYGTVVELCVARNKR